MTGSNFLPRYRIVKALKNTVRIRNHRQNEAIVAAVTIERKRYYYRPPVLKIIPPNHRVQDNRRLPHYTVSSSVGLSLKKKKTIPIRRHCHLTWI